ncbi:hypothetical protein, partial [Methylophaga muralis]|uniref:hypothetical protein n=1 Tax=Methylophaga muralis TaxID=291169 RepID=UPI00159F0803
YYAGSAIGALFGIFFKLMWLSLVYSPFVFVGGYVFFVLWDNYAVHGGVSAIGGIISAVALYILIFFFEGLKFELKSRGNKIWILLKTMNVLIVCGLPFILGGSLAASFMDDKVVSSVEVWIVFCFFGLFPSLIAYVGVFGQERSQRIKTET